MRKTNAIEEVAGVKRIEIPAGRNVPKQLQKHAGEIGRLAARVQTSIQSAGKPADRCVLICGGSKQNKTAAASMLAGQLAWPLFRIDLSQLVSKYIGETEKNLKALLSLAGKRQCVLFFDEADALFGKRGEIKDAHDRYANPEVSYLLDQMEHFNGLVILATNKPGRVKAKRFPYILELANRAPGQI